MAYCPECGITLPEGTAFRHIPGFGLPDKRKLDCPSCGAPLEPIRWTDLLIVAAVLALSIAARGLLGPFIDWNILAVALVLVVVHHVWALRKWRRRKREEKSLTRKPGSS